MVFETTSQTTGPGYVDRLSLLWSLHTKQAFSLLPLCAFYVNRHPRGQHVLGHLLFCSLESPTWPTNTLTSLVSQRNGSKTILFFYQNIVFSRAKWGEKPLQCQGQLSKQHISFHKAHDLTWPVLPATWSRPNLQLYPLLPRRASFSIAPVMSFFHRMCHGVLICLCVFNNLTEPSVPIYRPNIQLQQCLVVPWLRALMPLWTCSWWQHSRTEPCTTAC